MSKGMSKIIKCLILTLCFSVCCSLFTSCGQKEIEKTGLDAPVIASAVYTGEKLTADIPSNAGYTVVKNEGGTDVGEYDVVIKLSDSTKFAWKEAVANEAGEITLKFAITQADNAIDTLTLANWTFGETAKTPVATAKFGTPTFTYSDKEDGTFTDTVPTAVGSYFVKATVSETTNYKGATKTIAFSIEKVKATIATEPTAKENLKYTGSALELITAGSSNEGTLEYKLGTDGTYGTAIPTATAAGTYTVYYKVVGDENHSDLEIETPITVSIAKVASTLTTAPTAKTLTYTGSELALVEAGTATGGTIQYKVGNGEYSEAIPTATNAGDYTVYYKVVGDANHNDIDEASVEVTIARAAATLTAPTAKTLTYTGSAQALVEAGTATGGTIQYKLGADGTYGTTIPTATNAGDYTVYYKVVGDANHNDIAEANVTVTIATANATVTAPTAIANLVYTGKAQALVEAGSATGGTIQYKLGADGTYGTTIPTATNAGDYTVYYKVVGDANHNDTTEASVSVTIAKADNKITWQKDDKGNIVGLDFTYGNKPNESTATATAGEITYTYTLVNKNSTADPSEPAEGAKYTAWSNDNTSGLYKCLVTASGTANYKSITADRWVRVHKKEQDENGVAYTYDSAKDCYYVASYTGSNTEVTVASTFNDGANGEESVTLVGENCAWGTDVTKIILPACITDFKGNSFQSATNLEYISMTGVTHISTGNNFINNQKITTVIVNKAFTLDNQQFKMHNITADPTVVIYVDGTKAESTFAYVNKPDDGIGNEFLTGEVYYLGDGTKCLTWKFDDDGEIVKGASAHSFEDGACKTCGADQTAGITYAVSGDTAYVVSYSGTATEVYVRSIYEGKPVTFVKNCAFNNDSGHKITKIVLPESITTLDGSVFVNCTQLKYVSMVGVTKLDVDNLSNRSWYGDVYTANDATSNNFLNCSSLTTVIVGKNFETGSQFGTTNRDAACVNVYTLATSDTDGTITLNASSNALLTGNIYYYSESQPTDTAKTYWHYVDGVATIWETAE